MNNYLKEYQQKIISIDDAIDSIRTGLKVYIEQGPAEPFALIRGMMKSVERTRGIKLVIVPLPIINKVPFATPEYTDCWQIYTFFGGPALRKPIKEGRVKYVPIHMSEIPAAIMGPFRPDIAVIQVSPPDAAGYCSLGPAVDYNPAAIEAASTVIAQVNKRLPVTFGDSRVHLSRIQYLVEEESDLNLVPPVGTGTVESQIAGYVADLVSDGSTIQIGMGSLPDAILTAFLGKRELGVHSGMLSDRIVDLIEAGVVTGSRKKLNNGKVVAGVLVGTDRLYKFCHRNPMVEMYPTTYTHNRGLISQLENFVSINSAIEIDLTGQVNSETIIGEYITGIGGQVDFARIGRLSNGGKSIFAFPSMAKGKSRIVPQLQAGVPVSTPRSDVDYVVTEFGVANLRYRSLRERARALIGVAHPDFRPELKKWSER